MKQAILEQVVELFRETFEGALPGQGDHSRRDWAVSFEPQTVTDAEWSRLQRDLDLAYHLGAIRQLLHRAKGGGT